MNDPQENRLSMYYKVRTFFDVNLNTLSANLPALVGEKEKFNEVVAELEDYLTVANLDNTGFAAQKQHYREVLRDKALELSGALKAYFLLNGQITMANRANLTKSEFDSTKDGELKFLCMPLHEMATEHAAELDTFGFNSGRIAEILVAFNLYFSFIGQPGDQRSEGASANDMAERFFEKVDNQLVIIDALMLSLMNLHQALYLQYTYDRMIDDYGNNSPTPPDYEFTLAAGELKVVAELPYSSSRSFKAKNLGTENVSWSLSNVNNAFSSPAQILAANTSSSKLSSTLAIDGNFLMFQNQSTNPVVIEVTVFE